MSNEMEELQGEITNRMDDLASGGNYFEQRMALRALRNATRLITENQDKQATVIMSSSGFSRDSAFVALVIDGILESLSRERVALLRRSSNSGDYDAIQDSVKKEKEFVKSIEGKLSEIRSLCESMLSEGYGRRRDVFEARERMVEKDKDKIAKELEKKTPAEVAKEYGVRDDAIKPIARETYIPKLESKKAEIIKMKKEGIRTGDILEAIGVPSIYSGYIGDIVEKDAKFAEQYSEAKKEAKRAAAEANQSLKQETAKQESSTTASA